MEKREENKLIANFMGKRYDYLICDNCGKIDPELLTPNTRSRFTKCCAYDRPDIQGNLIHFSEGKTLSPHGSLSSDLKYHTSWDWLMPVVEKIEQLEYYVRIEQNLVTIYKVSKAYEWFGGGTSETKIESTYIAVIEFIKYYNARN